MRWLRVAVVTLVHLQIISVSLVLAYWLRVDFTVSDLDMLFISTALALAIPIKMAVFFAGRLHAGWWRYAGLSDLVRVFIVNVVASVLATAAIVWQGGAELPRSVYGIDFLLCFLLCAGARFSVRLYHETLKAELTPKGKSVLIYGAGSAGRTLLREIRNNRSLGYQVVGFVDDNPDLRSSRIMDVPIICAGRNLAELIDRRRSERHPIEEIIIAMPSASGRQMREAHANCRAAGVSCKTVPGVGDLLKGNYLSAQIRSISVEDLLGREQVRLEEDRIQETIVDRSILVTGGAGSIGSELCRQIMRCRPERLVILDQSESALFAIDQELRRLHPDLEIIPVVADIRDYSSVEHVIRTHSISSVYHAAAYKHVPMMEMHVAEAVRNNVFGTWNLVRAARLCGVSDFLMISSDKAVNPTSVMGATKRIAELIVACQSKGEDTDTHFVSVRFGNVLGSNGSVVPTFQAQIAAGGPVLVTHAEITRYFMSIREAVSLVLQASTMGKRSEIFVLDMGEPVRILDLAHNMIRLAGLVPNEDIEVRITGLRPGEKLYEEVMLDDEHVMPTHHEKIRIFSGSGPGQDVLTDSLNQLHVLLEVGDSDGIVRHLTAVVPEYRPARLEHPREETRVVPSRKVSRKTTGGGQESGVWRGPIAGRQSRSSGVSGA